MRVAERWFTVERAEQPGGKPVWRLEEPHVHALLRANCWFVPGRERDLLIDSGMGIAPIRPVIQALATEPGREAVHLCSHAHLDHVGGAHEFAERWIHPAEAEDLAADSPIATLRGDEYPSEYKALFREAGYPELDPLLIDALPWPGYDPDRYEYVGVAATKLLNEGDRIDIGDRCFEVWHLPGHSAGGIGLWDDAEGVLFAGDAVYDGPLILAGDSEDYGRTLRRLRDLDARVVHAGHDASFGAERLRAICEAYLRRWAL